VANLARMQQLDQLSGAQKAAILYMVLGAESTSLITGKLAQDEVEQNFVRIARMDRVSQEATDAVLSEWLEVMMAADSIAPAVSSSPAKSWNGRSVRRSPPA